jgi:hypothetical protein
MHFKGGPEGECVVVARGWNWIFPADVSLLDVIYTVNGRPPGKH